MKRQLVPQNVDWTIGADPEAFLQKNGGYVAVQNCGITGTKEFPQPLPNGGNVQRDNVAIEFGVIPASSKLDFVQNIGTTLSQMIDVLPEGVDIDIVPSANFPRVQLRHKECKMFGCDPDMNAWTMKENKPPRDAKKSLFRSCGGHIHIGYVKGGRYPFLQDLEGKSLTICMMDCFAGLVSTVLDCSDAAVARRSLYGKAGCFRATPYGVEYRTLSNYWIKSPKLVELMYSLTQDALESIANDKAIDIIMDLGPEKIQRVITEGDKHAAMVMVDRMERHMSKESISLFHEIWNAEEINYKEAWNAIN